MSPVALALAILLHILVVLALWATSLDPTQREQVEQAIEVTVERLEQPKPPPPPPSVPQPPAPAVEPGLRPPAPLTSDKPTQVPQAPVKPDNVPAPAPPASREAARPQLPTPEPPTPAPQPPPQASVAPPSPAPPHQLPQRPELRPAPHTPRPPAAPSAEQPSPSLFVNPAGAYNRARVADNYLWQVARKLVGYQYQANVNVSHGTTVVRIVIARDGRLLDVSIARSSGVPEFDRGVLAGVRAGSPYTPLPDDIKGPSATFDLPLVSIANR
jgi:TonB family protein